MVRFQAYRVRLISPSQEEFFPLKRSVAEILEAAIQEKPSRIVREPSVWHIGNVKPIDEHGYYFALGRTRFTKEEVFDESRRDFLFEEFEKAPFTHCIMDTRLQAVAIMPRSEVAPDTDLPLRLADLLNATSFRKTFGFQFGVDLLSDPRGFIQQIQDANRVIEIEFTFRRPNFIDVEQDIQNPLQRAAEELDADGGSVEFEGEDLDRGTIEKIAHAVAAAAEQLSAIIKPEEGARTEKKSLAGNPLTFQAEEVDTDEGRRDAIDELRRQYERVRSE